MGQSQNAITLTGNCSAVLQLLRDASPSVNGGVSPWPTSPDSCLMKWERESLRSKRAFTNAGTVLPDLHSGEEMPRSKSILWLPERLAPCSSNAAGRQPALSLHTTPLLQQAFENKSRSCHFSSRISSLTVQHSEDKTQTLFSPAEWPLLSCLSLPCTNRPWLMNEYSRPCIAQAHFRDRSCLLSQRSEKDWAYTRSPPH